VASTAKTPLLTGGTAVAGIAAGALVRNRIANKRSKTPLKRLRRLSLPMPATSMDLGDLDLKKAKSAAERVRAYGQQASDIIEAVEKTKKKNG
jgi:hypothetical protein